MAVVDHITLVCIDVKDRMATWYHDIAPLISKLESYGIVEVFERSQPKFSLGATPSPSTAMLGFRFATMGHNFVSVAKEHGMEAVYKGTFTLKTALPVTKAVLLSERKVGPFPTADGSLLWVGPSPGTARNPLELPDVFAIMGYQGPPITIDGSPTPQDARAAAQPDPGKQQQGAAGYGAKQAQWPPSHAAGCSNSQNGQHSAKNNKSHYGLHAACGYYKNSHYGHGAGSNAGSRAGHGQAHLHHHHNSSNNNINSAEHHNHNHGGAADQSDNWRSHGPAKRALVGSKRSHIAGNIASNLKQY